ncbi:UPF0147 family protein [Candidatus Woesearchaeota archaeon]|nr:UPF0147 family protein [Candidatus Woesearchaeota archaeon]
MIKDELNDIITILQSIKEDNTVPKNVKSRIDSTIGSLNSENEVSLRIDKALQELSEISNDPNVPAYTRIEILNLISLLSTDQ